MHSAIAGIADVLSIANHVMQQTGAGSRFTWQTLSLDGKAVRAGGGQMVAVDGAISKRAGFDAIVVPGNLVDHVTAERLQPQYARAGAWLRQQHANGRLIGAFCSGVFLLAGAGLLDHRRATITWWLQGELRQRHPTIDLAADAVIT
ncbi:DJ-1/PfpI family protein, partial [Xanthomonas citri pv. citri]